MSLELTLLIDQHTVDVSMVSATHRITWSRGCKAWLYNAVQALSPRTLKELAAGAGVVDECLGDDCSHDCPVHIDAYGPLTYVYAEELLELSYPENELPEVTATLKFIAELPRRAIIVLYWR